MANGETSERGESDETLAEWGEGVELPEWAYTVIPYPPPDVEAAPFIDPGQPHPADVEGGQNDTEVTVAVDWGEFISQTAQGVISGWVGQQFAPPVIHGSVPPGTGPVMPVPTKVTVDTKTGEVTPCKRRRRRRLLTSSDLSDLASLKTIVGGGAALNAAVVKAVRR